MRTSSLLAAALLLSAAAASAAEPTRRSPLWDESWPRFGRANYALTGTAAAAAFANFYWIPAPKSAVWKGPILFDRQMRNALLIGPEEGRRRARTLADALVAPLMGYALLDGPVAAGFGAGDSDAALQLALINAETFAVVNALNFTITNALPRSRPEGAVCDPESRYDANCVKSFWSGHTANAFASASLVCAEHEAIPLYGGKADAAACGAALSIAAAVGVSRITSNNHHASDVLVGAAVGGAVGYWMPRLLHFRTKKESKHGRLMPSVSPAGGALTYVLAW